MAVATVGSPMCIVVFGGAGDWTEREIIPSLFELYVNGHLHPETKILAVSRGINVTENKRSIERSDYLDFVRRSLGEHASNASDFIERFYFYSADMENSDSWKAIRDFCDNELMPEVSNRTFIITTLPSIVPKILTGIKTYGATSLTGGRSIAFMEKPFGNSAKECEDLFALAEAAVDLVIPVDHYRGKLALLQLSVMRREDRLISAIYNNQDIDSIVITADESDSLDTRHRLFADMRCGTATDMFLTHLLSTALWMAQTPESLLTKADREFVTQGQLHLLKDLTISDCVWGQYTSGNRSDNGRQKVKGVSELSNDRRYLKLPTFFACKLVFNGNTPLSGIPFYIRTGKGLAVKHTEITLQLKPPKESESGSQTSVRFIMNKRFGTRTETNGVVIENASAVNSHERSGNFFRPWTKIFTSATDGNGLDSFHPSVLTALWRIAEPHFEEFERKVEDDIHRAPADREVLKLYPFGSNGPSLPWFPKI
jgi:glucose-6-phosphate 1-dehydrogenase